ncbi:DUF3297 family protein [Formicincola oecophyllae]|uniref:DUF3297 family protein n=1 Tax=Formicincola oecophyllae TaxID=2558361 RepID=A0A4Y6U888_9PROT|nr:DUF3297 family protein [Formicincola oecophyllae]QDH13572.1 DUF3297 family protein [Formicincola oecophyllae]
MTEQTKTATQPAGNTAGDTPPDRMCIWPDSPHFNEQALSRGIEIIFNGKEKTGVEEYCVSEQWIRVPAGRSLDRRGRPMTLKMKGPVQVAYKS